MENGKQWVMLVAGSKGWDDYRHQANVCHAYQMMRQNGIPDDQIVVMMYDDIAYNDKNPYRGKIINKPKGPNVYPGVPKDYTGNDVTPENFLAALKGDRSAVRKRNPKVITSGRKDTIFIYMTDHGCQGLFCFPKSSLYAHDLIETIKDMARDKKFSKMVIYLESCYSGSMFTELPNDIHVYAVTSTKPKEKGYACYEDTERWTYLSDEFSAVWMHYSEKENLDTVTFQDQFDYLKKKMKTSCPCQFGDMTIAKRPISEFLKNTPRTVRQTAKAQMLILTGLTANHEVTFKLLKLRIETETDAGRRQVLIRKYEALYKTRDKIERTIEAINRRCVGVVVDTCDRLAGYYGSSIDLFAFKTVAEHFRTTCFNWHEEEFLITLSYMHEFTRLCANGFGAERIIGAITAVSSERPSMFF